jgi:hypothetical protein
VAETRLRRRRPAVRAAKSRVSSQHLKTNLSIDAASHTRCQSSGRLTAKRWADDAVREAPIDTANRRSLGTSFSGLACGAFAPKSRFIVITSTQAFPSHMRAEPSLRNANFPTHRRSLPCCIGQLADPCARCSSVAPECTTKRPRYTRHRFSAGRGWVTGRGAALPSFGWNSADPSSPSTRGRSSLNPSSFFTVVTSFASPLDYPATRPEKPIKRPHFVGPAPGTEHSRRPNTLTLRTIRYCARFARGRSGCDYSAPQGIHRHRMYRSTRMAVVGPCALFQTASDGYQLGAASSSSAGNCREP